MQLSITHLQLMYAKILVKAQFMQYESLFSIKIMRYSSECVFVCDFYFKKCYLFRYSLFESNKRKEFT